MENYIAQELRYFNKKTKEVVIYKLINNEYVRYGIVTYNIFDSTATIASDLKVKIDKWLPYIVINSHEKIF